MSGGYFDHRDQILADFGNKLKCEKLPARQGTLDDDIPF